MSFAPLFAMMGVVKKERRVGSALRGWGRRRGGKCAQKTRLTWWLYFSSLPVAQPRGRFSRGQTRARHH